MNNHSVYDNPVPCPELWSRSWILFWQSHVTVSSLVCTQYLILRSVECGRVEFTNFIWYYEAMTVESEVVVDDTIKSCFYIVLEYI